MNRRSKSTPFGPIPGSGKQISRRQLLKGMAGLAGIGVLGSIQGQRGWAASGKRIPALTFGMMGEISTFDPNLAATTNQAFFRQLNDVLVALDAEGKPHARLAEKYQLSPDGTSLTINLRKGLKYHSGAPVIATDVVKLIERARDSKTGGGIYGYTATIKEAVAKDDTTLVINYTAPNPGYLNLLNSLYIINPASLADLKMKIDGTGPWKLVERIPGDKISMARNPHYWATPLPNADKLTAKIFGDEDAMIAALESGAIDMVYWFPLKHYPRLKDKLQFVFGPANTRVWELRMQTKKTPFDDKKVRQAIAYGIDRASVVKDVMFGVGAPTPHSWGKTHPAYDASYEGRNAFDLNKTKSLLTAAGKPNGKFTILLSTADAEGKGIASILQADLMKIGWTVELDVLDPARFSPRLVAGDFQMAINASGQFDLYTSFAAANSVYRISGNPVWTEGKPPANYIAGIKAAESTVDPAKQKATLKQVAETLLDEAWTIPICWQVTLYGATKKVRGIEVVAVGRPVFEGVTVE
jgi:peptide/nickel transport system substrate-binding protein